MKKGDIYKGFRVLEYISNVKDCDAPGIWLKHERTGMEVFHVLKDDEENLFSFVFRTPAQNSSGVAHIIEHSVLCGSEKFPLKDPFIRLSNQSLATYLNAFTSPDYTAFPSSSVIKADYFNTFAVYADAVFFPLLKEEVFLQEGHRLEFDDKGRPIIQGVVYNEMKGKYSSYESVVSDEIDNITFAGTRYTNDAGGNPTEIPKLTYKQFKDFYKKHYTPANCLVFLYGNIPTEEQLDFLDENVLSKISKAGKKIKYSSCSVDAKLPKRAHVYGPANENETKDTVVCAWKLDFPQIPRNELRIELTFLNNLIWSSDSAPVTKDLMDSGLGEDIAPQTGMTLSLQCQNAVCGLRGVDKKNANAIKETIFSSLEKICREGLTKNHMERICMTFDFYNREISRNGGPQGLVMLRRCLRGWVYGDKPWESLELFNDFAKLKQRLQNEPEYLSEMIHRYFLDNKNFSVITASPSQQWLNKRFKIEKQNAAEELEKITKEKAIKKLEKMLAFQQKEESEDDDNLIPRLSISQLDTKTWNSPISCADVNGIPLFSNTEPTNGIIYFSLFYTIDNLTPEEYKYVSMVASSCTDVGWGNVSWSDSQEMQQRLTGNFSVHTESMCLPSVNKFNPDSPYVGRDWFVVSLAVLEDKLSESLDLVADIMQNVDYSDLERLDDLLKASLNSDKSSFASYASQYAYSRAKRKTNRSSLLKELWSGLTSVYTNLDVAKMGMEKAGKLFYSILRKVLNNGAIMHVVSTKNGIKLLKKQLPSFVEKMHLKPVVKKTAVSDEELVKLTELPGEIVNPASKKADIQNYVDEVVLINGTVGTVYSAIDASEYKTREAAAETVFCHSMTNKELWDEIRTKGGAYGVYFQSSALSGHSFYGTYRDPRPFDSAATIKETFKNAKKRVYTQEEVEKSIIGRYASMLEPVVPSERGLFAFLAMLQGRSVSDVKKIIQYLFALKPKDIHKIAEIYGDRINKSDKRFETVIFCPKELFLPKNKENTGKIIDLPV